MLFCTTAIHHTVFLKLKKEFLYVSPLYSVSLKQNLLCGSVGECCSFPDPSYCFSWHKKYFSSLKFTAQLNFCATHNKVFFWDANNSFCTCKFYSFPDHHSNRHKKLCLHVNLTVQLTFRAIPRLLLLWDAKNQCSLRVNFATFPSPPNCFSGTKSTFRV